MQYKVKLIKTTYFTIPVTLFEFKRRISYIYNALHAIFAGTCPTGCEYVWLVNETKTKIHHTNSTPSSHTCQSLPSKVKYLPRDFTPQLYTLVTYVPVTTFKGKISTSRFYSSAIHPRHIRASHYLQR